MAIQKYQTYNRVSVVAVLQAALRAGSDQKERSADAQIESGRVSSQKDATCRSSHVTRAPFRYDNWKSERLMQIGIRTVCSKQLLRNKFVIENAGPPERRNCCGSERFIFECQCE